jgi:nicotinamide riboside kinase
MADSEPQEGAGPRRCANPDCQVAVDGRCIEGFPETAECPQFGRISIMPVDATPGTYPAPRNGVATQASTTLSVDEADDIVKERPSRVIAIAGPQSAGKTSLIAGLYDLFQLGQVGNVAFAKSYSLHAFEQAAHDSRAASRRMTPNTARTERGEVRFYHLELVDTDSGAMPSVLLGDRAGEEYLETRSNPLSAQEFPELRRADVLTLLVDGERLLDVGQRHNLRSEVRQTLHAVVEAGVVRPTQRLALVLTKLDVIRKAADGGRRNIQGFDTLVTGLRTDYGSNFAAVESFQIAAQPSTDGAKRGENLDRLLAYWMAEPLRYRPCPIVVEVPEAERYFDRLMPVPKDVQ